MLPEEGYFAFGEATCYGRTSGRPTSKDVTGILCDVSDEVESADRQVRLPFDLSEVVTNLRQERYCQDPSGTLQRMTEAGSSRNLYYFVRPLLPVWLRRHLQKIRLNGWDQIVFPRWPVDFTVDTLMQSVMRLAVKSSGAEIPFIWFWPDGSPSCGIMTHDVETRTGRDFCDVLMDMDDAHGIKSAFQVVPEARYDVPGSFLEGLRGRGFEVNVHDLNHDGRLYRDRDEFLQRAAKINTYARAFQSRGFRAGAMYRRQDWFEAFDFSYDMSVPNVAHLEPQRGGCCTVMPYFIGRMLELPLTTIQDYSLFHILGDYSIERWKTQIDLIRSRNGLISFITHPDYLMEQRARTVYLDLLAHLRRLADERKIWLALPGEVDRWWRSRNLMTLSRTGDSWHVEGPDSDRARVAYATLEQDRLVYRLEPLSRAC